VSRWLQQQIQPQYPEVQILEVLEADGGFAQVDADTCYAWMQTNGVTHPVLRDRGGATSVASLLVLQAKDILVTDRFMKIVYKGRVTDTLGQSQVKGILGGLK
jgi:hypothetical protein